MGHLSTLSPEHRALLGRLDAGPVSMPEPKSERARTGWQEILEILFTREDAALAARLPLGPTSLNQVARRVGRSPDELKPQLERMADKGIVSDLVDPKTGKTTYQLSPPIVGFFEYSMMRGADAIPKKRMAEALDAYEHGDDTFAKEAFNFPTVVGRALVHETAVAEEALPDVLDWERASALIDEARAISLQRCFCRQKAEYLEEPCDVPIDRCLALNMGARYLVRHGFARPIEKSEAMDVLEASRADNLVQIADNIQDHPAFICNCCPCHCGLLGGITEWDLPAVNPSAFQATCTDTDLCKGCSRCSRVCPAGAITMVAVRVDGQRKNKLMPVINVDRCIGCGICVDQCRQHTMRMERRPVEPHVPVNTVERVVRMSLERGRLPHLLFDAGKNRSSRYFNSVLRALCALPPVEKTLASEQVRSRFVDYALKNIKTPA